MVSVLPQLIYILINEFNSFIFGLLIRLEFVLLALLIWGEHMGTAGYWQGSIYGPGWCCIKGKPSVFLLDARTPANTLLHF